MSDAAIDFMREAFIVVVILAILIGLAYLFLGDIQRFISTAFGWVGNMAIG